MIKHQTKSLWLVLLLVFSTASCVQTQNSANSLPIEPPPELVEQSEGQKENQQAWPREISVPEGVVIIYQPQPDKLEGNQLSGRMAVSVELTKSDKPVFGALWFEARLQTDRATRTATIADLDITQIRFANPDEQKADKLRNLLETEIPNWQLPIEMDRLLTTLDLAEKKSQGAEKIVNNPPIILFSSEPAVLISLDGEPQLAQIDSSSLKRVVNTPFTLLFDSNKKTYYLYADKDTWYTTSDFRGKWRQADDVPREVAALAPVETDQRQLDKSATQAEAGTPPNIIIATEPTELITSQGKPEYKPIDNTSLLYMSNSDSDVLLDINSQLQYVLLAGRWYVSEYLKGPWRYVPGEKLPADFAKIPEGSEMETVLFAVPGTNEAKEAVLDAQIPQTAAIQRTTTGPTVKYDGDPNFQPIEDTTLTYAVNTITPVIRVANQYYAVDQGVWFVADKPDGPWQVATSIPDEIYTIPATSPLYNVTFVHVYQATPEVVYVGYTPGYTHSHVYHDTIIYGSGYHWPGWFGSYYYPYPATWGYHVRWSPWRGWGFGFSYGNSPYRFTVGYSGWWGPRSYYGYRNGYRHGYRDGSSAGYRSAYNAGQRADVRQNLYQSDRNQQRLAASQSPPTVQAASLSSSGKAAVGGVTALGAAAVISNNRSNDVYSDKSGDVYRKAQQGWQQRSEGGWQDTKPSQLPSQPTSRPTTQQLDRSYQNRQRGAQRASTYRQSGGGRPGGGRVGRGGGGRRR